jgi:hypothetical protein
MSTSVTAPPGPARSWPRNEPLAAAIGLLLIGAAFLLLALDGDAIDRLVSEDGVIEWAGALGLFAGAGLFFAAFLAARRDRPAWLSPLGVWVLLGLAVALLFLAGEEISWGQRLFGWGTPEALAEANAQDETTLHNLNLFQGTSLDGDRLFRLAWIGLFVAVPALAWLWPRGRRLLTRHLPVVPLWLAGLFLAAWVFTTIAVRIFDGGWDATYAIGSAGTEIQEALVELLMGLAAFVVLLGVRSARRTP